MKRSTQVGIGAVALITAVTVGALIGGSGSNAGTAPEQTSAEQPQLDSSVPNVTLAPQRSEDDCSLRFDSNWAFLGLLPEGSLLTISGDDVCSGTYSLVLTVYSQRSQFSIDGYDLTIRFDQDTYQGLGYGYVLANLV